MSIILIGHKGSGKSYCGKEIARSLQWDFVDTDTLIEKLYFERRNVPLTCCRVYLEHGDQYFRNLESEVIQHLSFEVRRILSIGAGATLNENNLRHLKTLGKLLFLNASKSLLKKRLLSKNESPAYLDPINLEESFEKMYLIRQNHYQTIKDEEVSFEKDGMGLEKLWQVIASDPYFASPPSASPTEKPLG